VFTKEFLDFSTKMKSPDFILPDAPSHDRNTLLQALPPLKEMMLEAATTMDLTRTCKSIALSSMGYLTRYEWLSVITVHTQRHIHQLEEIWKVISTNPLV
ncbi:MAG TPA: hypothetical protein VL947_02570, partial [Cytophagales bacterium]|nr:hypothetical protein [Cytophagales bacterium]